PVTAGRHAADKAELSPHSSGRHYSAEGHAAGVALRQHQGQARRRSAPQLEKPARNKRHARRRVSKEVQRRLSRNHFCAAVITRLRAIRSTSLRISATFAGKSRAASVPPPLVCFVM